MKLLPLVTEDHKHDYGCVMLHFDFPELCKIQDMINPDDIYEDENDDSFELESEFHITLLFGLHDEVSTNNIKKVLEKFEYGPCKLTNPSIFENEKYDVFKYDVVYPTRGGAFLHKTNYELKKLPHTSEFPEYNPHVTIGYLKPKKGQRYVKAIKNSEFIVTPKYAIYSKPDGTKEKLNINVKK